jgi:hypothetical protein
MTTIFPTTALVIMMALASPAFSQTDIVTVNFAGAGEVRWPEAGC